MKEGSGWVLARELNASQGPRCKEITVRNLKGRLLNGKFKELSAGKSDFFSLAYKKDTSIRLFNFAVLCSLVRIFSIASAR
jgi:hypothetical protein